MVHNARMATPEWKLQAYVSTQLKRAGVLHHGDQNAGKRGPRAQAIAKATGMCKGWPDMCIPAPGGTTEWIEFKTGAGVLSKEQTHVHETLRKYGHNVTVVIADNEIDAWEQVKKRLWVWVGK